MYWLSLCTDEMACPVNNSLNFSVLERENLKEDSGGKTKENVSGGGK